MPQTIRDTAGTGNCLTPELHAVLYVGLLVSPMPGQALTGPLLSAQKSGFVFGLLSVLTVQGSFNFH